MGGGGIFFYFNVKRGWKNCSNCEISRQIFSITRGKKLPYISLKQRLVKILNFTNRTNCTVISSKKVAKESFTCVVFEISY